MLIVLLAFLLPFTAQTINAQDGKVTWEIWKDKSTAAGDLPTFFNLTAPTQSGTRTDLCFMGSAVEMGSDLSNFVYRMSGYIFPSETGSYTFYSASDDDGQFWLNLTGASSTQAELTKVAWTEGWSANKEWTTNANNKTAGPVTLTAGKPYYFVAFFREGSGGDGLTLGWKTPSVPGTVNCIGSANISSVANSVVTVSLPAQAAGNIQREALNAVIYRLKLSVAQASTKLAGLKLTTAGTYAETDVTNFKLWYNATAASLIGATEVGSAVASAASGSVLDYSFDVTIPAGSNGYFLLTGDVAAAATLANTISIAALAETDVTVTGANQFANTWPVMAGPAQTIVAKTDKQSDIVASVFTLPENIDYKLYQGTVLDENNSIALAKFTVRDGGASADADNVPTKLTGISLSLTNPENVAKVALFDGSIKLAEIDAAAILAFSGFELQVPDNGSKEFTVRASYKNVVTDNLVNNLQVKETVADGTGSTFAAIDGGGATSNATGDQNKVAVVASKLVFTTQPSATALYGAKFQQSAVVKAQDANGSVDLDWVTDVTLSNNQSVAMTNNVLTPVAGVASFTNFTIPAVADNVLLTATSGSLTEAISTAVKIISPISGSDTDDGNMGNTLAVGSSLQRILRVTVKSIATVAQPDAIKEFTFNTGLATNPADIVAVEVFSLDQWGGIQWGSRFGVSTTLVDNKFTVTGNYPITETKDYKFEVLITIAQNATDGNKADMALESAKIGETVFTPTLANGTRTRSILNQGLTGVISIDNTLAANEPKVKYKDFKAALDDLNKYGVGEGGVTFVLTDGQEFSYTSRLSINQGGRPGSPLVFKRSGTGANLPIVSVEHGGEYYPKLLTFHNVSYLTIDGIYFKGVQKPAKSDWFASTGLVFQAYATQTLQNITVTNCVVDMGMDPAYITDARKDDDRFGGIGIRFGYSHDTDFSFAGAANNVVISNNQIRNVREGIRFERRAGAMQNIAITGNTIENFINRGIYVFKGEGARVEGPILIDNNTLRGNVPLNWDGNWGGTRESRGILLNNFGGTASISNNKVSAIYNNHVNSTVAGIQVQCEDAYKATTVVTIANNAIWDVKASNSTNTEGGSFGIRLYTGFNLNVYHNSVMLDYVGATKNQSVALRADWDYKIMMKNNVFVNKVTPAADGKAIVINIDPSRLLAGSDYNYYFAGTPSAINLINANGSKQTLADYKTQAAGKEVNSITGDGNLFVSSTDLHVKPEVTATLAIGAVLPEVTTDFEGEPRSATAPLLGADEYHTYATSVSIASTGNVSSLINGNTLQYTATVTGGDAGSLQDVIWSVDKPELATISASGLLSAVKAGTVQVTATLAFGPTPRPADSKTLTITPVAVSSINLSATSAQVIKGSSLQINAEVLPVFAENKTLIWSVINGTGEANINQDGLLTAVKAGSVTVKASATDGSNVEKTFDVTINPLKVADIQVTLNGGGTTIGNHQNVQLLYTVLPEAADNKSLTWSVVNGTGEANIDQNGMLTTIKIGTVTVTAAANDGSNVKAIVEFTIEPLKVSSITITSPGNVTSMINKSTLQLSADILPALADNKSFTWNVVNTTGEANISETGLLSAVKPGNVTVEALATDGSNVKGSFELTINPILVTSLVISSQGNVTEVVDKGQLQLSVAVEPANADDKSFTWIINNLEGQVDIDDLGKVTAMGVGLVKLSVMANDGSNVVSQEFELTVTPIKATSIDIQAAASTISVQNGSLQLSAVILPTDASIKNVDWSVSPAIATIDATGKLQASGTWAGNGAVIVKATAKDGSGIEKTYNVTISGQNVAPVAGTQIAAQSVKANEALSFVLPANAFTHNDAGDELSFTATLADGSALPAWLSFNATSKTFSGTATSQATLTIKVTATDEANAKASTEFTLVVTGGVGVAEISAENVRVSPNPTTGVFFIDMPETRGMTQVVISSLNGSVVYNQPQTEAGRITIDLTGKAAGVYFVTIRSSNAVVTKKLILE